VDAGGGAGKVRAIVTALLVLVAGCAILFLDATG
jgi:hypothetical protein